MVRARSETGAPAAWFRPQNLFEKPRWHPSSSLVLVVVLDFSGNFEDEKGLRCNLWSRGVARWWLRLGRSGDRPFRLSVPEYPSRAFRFHSPLIKPDVPVSGKAAAFQRMWERGGWYDPNVLAAASRCFEVWLGVADEKRPPPQPMRIDDRRSCPVLAQDIRTKDGNLILAADTKLSPTILEKLVNFQTLGTIDGTILVHRA